MEEKKVVEEEEEDGEKIEKRINICLQFVKSVFEEECYMLHGIWVIAQFSFSKNSNE